MQNKYHTRTCPNVNCNNNKDCCPFRKIVIPAVMGDDSEGSDCAPENGAYRNALVEYAANGAMYIYASDGIFTKISMVSGSSGAATIRYVDAQDADVLAEAKAYTDAHSGGSAEPTFIDLTVTGYEVLPSGIINISATASKTLAEAKTLWESGALVVYRLVLSASPAPGSIYPGTYEIQPLYVGTNMAVGSYMDSANDMNMAMTHTASGVTILYYTTEQVMGNYGYVKENELSTVATTGAYDDLTGTPEIPTVNNATLTIQKNGTTVQTFTANQSTNATANITVPNITLQTTDPGEGSALAANNFIGVYS